MQHSTRAGLLAEKRIGQELKAAQERGEVATRDDGVNQHEGARTAGTQPATLPDINIPSQRASEFKAAAGDLHQH